MRQCSAVAIINVKAAYYLSSAPHAPACGLAREAGSVRHSTACIFQSDRLVSFVLRSEQVVLDTRVSTRILCARRRPWAVPPNQQASRTPALCAVILCLLRQLPAVSFCRLPIIVVHRMFLCHLPLLHCRRRCPLWPVVVHRIACSFAISALRPARCRRQCHKSNALATACLD